ncbi:MAG TPA: DNA primase, partial [Verrucomicrobiae bacterium]
NAIVRALDHLLGADLAIRVAVVPPPHDPDTYIKEFGGEAFNQLVTQAEGFFDYLLKRLCLTNDPTSDKGRLTILKAMAEALLKTNNSVLLDTHAQKTALRLGVNAEAVRKEFQKFKITGGYYPAEADGPDDATLAGEAEEHAPTRPNNDELHLLKILFRHEELAVWLAGHLVVGWIAHPIVRQILETRIATVLENNWHSLAEFLENLPTPFARNLITEVVADGRKLPSPETQIADVTLKLRNKYLEQQIASLTNQAAQPDLNDADRLAILQALQQAKNFKRSPLTPLPDPADEAAY